MILFYHRGNSGKRKVLIGWVLVVWLAALGWPTLAQTAEKGTYTEMAGFGLKSSEKALKQIGRAEGEALLVITNAGYVRLQGQDTSPMLDGLQKGTGVSLGRGNLLIVHESPHKPFFVFIYNAQSDKAWYMEIPNQGQGSGTAISETLQATRETLEEGFLAHQLQEGQIEQWAKEKRFGGNAYRLSMITRIWKIRPSPELRHSFLFHDHLCPGVTSGYYLAKFIQKHFPLGPGESYFMIASPVWCKDDALQMILNATPGKRSFAVIPFNDADKACLADEAKEAAGMIIRYHRQTKKGTGAVLGFSWDKLRNDAGWKEGRKASAADNLRLAQWMIEKEGDFEKYVRVIKTFALPEGYGPEEWVRPGVNPWVKAELWKCPKNP
jgi:formylmethanofuran dehydrogenase subunit E-like metal-binding protein